jgi:hypothetical protein
MLQHPVFSVFKHSFSTTMVHLMMDKWAGTCRVIYSKDQKNGEHQQQLHIEGKTVT